jgi:hypothetical protein
MNTVSNGLRIGSNFWPAVKTPETSEHTSAALRIRDRQQPGCAESAWLAPLTLDETAAPGPQCSQARRRASDKGFLPLSSDDYLMLLDWTGRQVVRGKSGSVPAELAPIVQRLGIEGRHWYRLATRFGQLFYVVAGNRASLTHEATRHQRRWYQAPGGQLLTATAA